MKIAYDAAKNSFYEVGGSWKSIALVKVGDVIDTEYRFWL